MDGITIWENRGRKILRVDYALIDDLITAGRATLDLQENMEGPVIYALIDFANRPLSQEYVEMYKQRAVEIAKKKVIVAAYLGLATSGYDAARKVLNTLPPKSTYVEFFETEVAAIGWLLSFDRRIEERRVDQLPIDMDNRVKERRKESE